MKSKYFSNEIRNKIPNRPIWSLPGIPGTKYHENVLTIVKKNQEFSSGSGPGLTMNRSDWSL